MKEDALLNHIRRGLVILERIEAQITELNQKARGVATPVPTTPVPTTPIPTTTIAAYKCPLCASEMVQRLRRSDNQAFWGCSTFPKCTGSRDITGKNTSRPSGPPPTNLGDDDNDDIYGETPF